METSTKVIIIIGSSVAVIGIGFATRKLWLPLFSSKEKIFIQNIDKYRIAAGQPLKESVDSNNFKSLNSNEQNFALDLSTIAASIKSDMSNLNDIMNGIQLLKSKYNLSDQRAVQIGTLIQS